MTPSTTDSADREQVLTWLAGRLRFEQLLASLHAGPTDRQDAETLHVPEPLVAPKAA